MTYPGGKGKCFQKIINLMPPHDVYIETHLGSGAVLRNKKPALKNIGIDLDFDVIQSWIGYSPENHKFFNNDALAFLTKYLFTGKELVYCDPPYVLSTRRKQKIYKYEYTDEQHGELLDLLCKIPCMVMISGYENELYDEKLSLWRKEKFFSKTHNGVREECVWLNFPPADKLHDASFLGANFRERYTIKKRLNRLIQKFELMDPIERDYILEILNKKYI
ncbi:DNA adenine methylase [Aggregatibacter actinomycetemcomitans]|uniref:DNA adenine methylase n=1 Tax=Aggregatibacter actinomycetemcomitans TaxID=714 RepID=UPI0006805D5A|nr:DNA adenine methylase [Aggregatibacter actinomycetemcomitans]